MHETMQSAGRRADWVNCPHMEKERRCTGPREVQKNNYVESYYEIVERILDRWLRERVQHEFDEDQQGFIKERVTTDEIFSLRQLVEKILERQGNMALALVDIENAFDTVPRKMGMATLRWMGAPESEVKMVEALYENTKGREVVRSGMSNAFRVTICLRQAIGLIPLLFNLVMELISRKICTTYALRNIMCAIYPVIFAEHREELQGALEECNEMFKETLPKDEPRQNRSYVWLGNREREREELNIRSEGKDIKQVYNVCIWVDIYLITGEWWWRCHAEYKQERMHGET